jgi:hypothetical protein
MVHEFVHFIPEQLDDGVVYVTLEYATAVHRCCCGCGSQVVTPLAPDEWKLIFDGETISFDPSIGNWSFPCQSHYWVRRNKVVWAGQWTKEQIGAGRARDQALKEGYAAAAGIAPADETASTTTKLRAGSGWFHRIRRWF